MHQFSTLRVALRYCGALLGLTLPAAGAGDVLVVDAAGGSPYATIQAAVDAAVDGDTVLIKPGSYAAFVVTQKDLSLVGDGSPLPIVTGETRVLNLLASQAVLLAGLDLRGVKLNGAPFPTLVIADTLGAVRVEDCLVQGADAVWCPTGIPGFWSCPIPWPEGACAAIVSRAADVTFARCVIQGGQGLNDHPAGNNPGGDGMVIEGSRVSLYAGDVGGGRGGGQATIPFGGFAEGGNGGRGVFAIESGPEPVVLHLSGTTVRGGDGGPGADCIEPSGWGGAGVQITGSGAGGARLVQHGSTLSGGLGGCWEPDGAPLILDGGATQTILAGSARRARVTNPVREGQPMQFVFEGEPGDRVFLIASLVPDFRLLVASGGVLHLGSGTFGALAFQGVVPAGGILTVPATAPTLPPGVDGQRFFLQTFFRDLANARRLATPLTPVVLDASF